MTFRGLEVLFQEQAERQRDPQQLQVFSHRIRTCHGSIFTIYICYTYFTVAVFEGMHIVNTHMYHIYYMLYAVYMLFVRSFH